MGTQGQTLVLDWGCAKNIGDADTQGDPESGDLDFEARDRTDITIAGAVMGTIEFMSPEQASGGREHVGPASDVFGLGATLLSLLTGKFAYKNDSDVNCALEKVRKGDFHRVDELSDRVPAPLVAICHHAMQRNPDDRYATAGELAKDIDAFLAGEPVAAYQETVVDRMARFVRSHQTGVATSLGALIVGFASLLLVTFMIDRQRDALADKNDELGAINQKLAASVATEHRLMAAATEREQTVRQRLYESEMLLASEASTEPGGLGRMQELAGHWRGSEFDSLRGWEWHHLESLGHREQWKADLNATANRILVTRNNPLACVFDSGRGLVTTIDLEQRRSLGTVRLPRGATVVDLNHDQSRIAVGLPDGNVQVFATSDMDAAPVPSDTARCADHGC